MHLIPLNNTLKVQNIFGIEHQPTTVHSIIFLGVVVILLGKWLTGVESHLILGTFYVSECKTKP